jgi:maltooligosyltrehalose trehalohydrolase
MFSDEHHSAADAHRVYAAHRACSAVCHIAVTDRLALHRIQVPSDSLLVHIPDSALRNGEAKDDMQNFRVWAPKATRVQVKIGDNLYALSKQDDPEDWLGWWSGSLAVEGDEIDYSYLLDEDPLPLPDPRSAWQPHGVHGSSRVVNHSRFQWSDAHWQAPPLASGIVYELHIGTFTSGGTFDAAIERLDSLIDLGITHVEIMPVAAFPGERGWGYDGVDIYAPQQSYGGPEGLKRFVDASHRKGLAVLLDVVYNHLGPVGNYLQRFGPYFTHSHTTPWGDAVNLEEAGSAGVRRYLCDNALMWLRDYHFDGLRLDAVHAFIDRSAIHFLEQLEEEVKELQAALGKRFVVIAESDQNDPRLVASVEAGGYGLDAQWSDDFHHALVTALTGERHGYYSDFGSLADLAKSLERVFVYDGGYSCFRQRRHGRPVKDLPGWRFLGYAQNHDQVGNRARGERLGHLVSEGRAKIAAALVLCSPFVPMLFQGEEFNTPAPFLYFTHHEDEELGRMVSEGRTQEFSGFGWHGDVPDPQSVETFQRSRLDWSECEQDRHRSMLDWYKALIQLRRSNPCLCNGRLDEVQVRFDEEMRWISLDRGPVALICNLGLRPLLQGVSEHARILLASEANISIENAEISVPPDAAVVIYRS